MADKLEDSAMQELDGIARAIHDGLGGDGWAYSNYGHDEWNSMRDELRRAAYAVMLHMRKTGNLLS